MLAERISVLASSAEEDDLPLSGSFELWALVAQHFSLLEFAAICRLGASCRSLRPLARLPELWEALCRQAYSLPGFRSPEKCVREYNFSWRNMFQQRPRLRFDGLYFITTSKLLQGMNEGRGMKEEGKDFYNPGGRWATSFRVLRFFPDGSLFSYLCSSHTPADIRKIASLVQPSKPSSLSKLKNAIWGRYSVLESNGSGGLSSGGDGSPEGAVESADSSFGDDTTGTHTTTIDGVQLRATSGGAKGRVTLTASLIQFSEQYPNMTPGTIRYAFELRPSQERRVGAAGSNAKLHLTAHAIESIVSHQPLVEHLAVPSEPANFITFQGPVPPMYPERKWVNMTPRST